MLMHQNLAFILLIMSYGNQRKTLELTFLPFLLPSLNTPHFLLYAMQFNSLIFFSIMSGLWERKGKGGKRDRLLVLGSTL